MNAIRYQIITNAMLTIPQQMISIKNIISSTCSIKTFVLVVVV